MRFNRVKKLWREGKPAVGGWLSIPHCFAAEVMAHTGLDWLCVDMQHGCIDYSDAVPMMTATAMLKSDVLAAPRSLTTRGAFLSVKAPTASE